MVDTAVVRTIVGIIGNIISFGLFCSPIPTFVNIWKMKSVTEFKPDPYVATLLNCLMWTFYGMPFVHPDSLLVVTINGTGLVIELIYVSIYLAFAPWPKRKKVLIALAIEAAFSVIVIFCTLTFLDTTKKRSMLVGIICIVLNIIMYASPLTIMKKVIRTKSVKYMPFALSLANFLNGIVWVIYALLKFDLYIVIPNSLGTLSGVVQLMLYGLYYRTTDWDEDDEDDVEAERYNRKAAELELGNKA